MKKKSTTHRNNSHTKSMEKTLNRKQDSDPNEHPDVAECCRELGCELLNVEVRHKLNPDTFWIPEARVRHRLYPGCHAKVFFKAHSPAEGMWVLIWAVRADGLYVGVLNNMPLYPYRNLHLDSQVVFAPHHVCAVDLPDGRRVGTLAELPSPDAKLVDLTGETHPCAGCGVSAPRCEGCTAIQALRKSSIFKVQKMKTNKGKSKNYGAFFAITADGPNETTLYPVTTVHGANGTRSLIAVLEVLGETTSSIDGGRSMRDILCIVTPQANIYPELKAKLASIE